MPKVRLGGQCGLVALWGRGWVGFRVPCSPPAAPQWGRQWIGLDSLPAGGRARRWWLEAWCSGTCQPRSQASRSYLMPSSSTCRAERQKGGSCPQTSSIAWDFSTTSMQFSTRSPTQPRTHQPESPAASCTPCFVRRKTREKGWRLTWPSPSHGMQAVPAQGDTNKMLFSGGAHAQGGNTAPESWHCKERV